jgi:tetratricopeptide (TPR) repeat protein/transglutaminase-like putative cysteine protease
MTRPYAPLLVCLLSIAGAFVARASDFSRTPPDGYEARIAPLLTPLDKVLEKKDAFSAKDGDSSILLDEVVEWIDAHGRTVSARHVVRRSLDDAGSKDIATQDYPVRRGEQKISLLLARTILPDGRKIDVQPNAAFIKSPQNDAGDSLYGDEDELVVIFPSISTGAITESIVVIDEPVARIPGEYVRTFYWETWWPVVEKRRTVELPASYVDRLQIIDLGAGVPSLSREKTPDGDSRFSWLQEMQPAAHWEANAVPLDQTGPATELTTLPDWNGFAAWYGKLLKEHSTLSPKLRSEVDSLTKTAKSPREVIDILTRKVARDVRYTGLEFGLAGFQPADCNQVWANGYGDCKDKANLLRAMLAAKGLRAYLALVNAEHEGKVDRRAPSYLPFDHAIVAVEESPGKLVFCDPTIEYDKAGMISPASADRDVFLVNEQESKWSHTPAAEGGALSFHFDLKITEQGEVSGWMTRKSTGYYASGDLSRFSQLDHDDLVSEIRGMLRSFFPTASVIDAKLSPATRDQEAFQLRAFFIAPTGGGSSGRLTVPFPFSSDLAPNVNLDRPRRTDFFQWRDKVEIGMHLALPSGFAASDLPAPYELQSPVLSAHGLWKSAAGGVDASLVIDTKASVVPPDEFATLVSASRSLQSWAAQMPTVRQTAGENSNKTSKVASADDDSDLDGFPMLATPEGQRDLLDERFPSDSGNPLRKRALQRLAQYFPDDAASLFYSAMGLVSIQDDEGDHAGAAAKAASLLDAYRGKVDAEWIAWGRYVLALCYVADKHSEKALPIFLGLAADKSISDHRRGWSAYQAAKILQDSKASQAIQVLSDAISLDSSALPNELDLLTNLLVKSNNIEALRSILGRLAASKSDEIDEAVAACIGAVPQSALDAVADMVEKAGLGSGEKTVAAIASARKDQRLAKSYDTIAGKLKAYLKDHPIQGPRSSATTPEALQKEIDAAIDRVDPTAALDLTLQRLTEFPPDSDFSKLLWRASTRAEWLEKLNGVGAAGPIFPFILDLCDMLPKEDGNYYDARFVLGRRFERAGDFAQAEKVFAGILADGDLSRDYTLNTIRDLGRTQEEQGRYQDALHTYLQVKSRIGEASIVSDIMLRAVLIQLALNQPDEALDILHRLDKVDPDTAKNADASRQIAQLVALGRKPDVARQYWQAAKGWQGKWEKVLTDISPSGTPRKLRMVPVISDATDLNANFQKAVQSQDRAALVDSLDLLSSATRWEPDTAPFLAESLPFAVNALPQRDCSRDNPLIFQVAISTLTDVPDIDTDLSRRRDLMLAATLLDAGHSDAAITIINRFLKTDQTQDEVHFAMVRVLGVASYTTKELRSRAITELTKDLALDDAVADRAETVGTLAQIYDLEQRFDDERALLEKELENPRVKSSAQIDALRARAQTLGSSGGSTADFSKFLAGWMAEYCPSWYDVTGPTNLSDPLVKDSSDAGASLKPAEWIKWKLLVANDPSTDLPTRIAAWRIAAAELFDLIPSKKQADHFIRSIIGSPSLSKQDRCEWLYVAMFDAASRLDKTRYEAYRKDPLYGEFTDAARQNVSSLAETLDTDRTNIASIEKSFQKLGQRPVGDGEVSQLQILFKDALALGELDAAHRMYDQFQTFSPDKSCTSKLPAISLSLLRQLKAAETWLPAYNALRAEVPRLLPPAALQKPPSLDDIRNPYENDMIEQADAQSIRLYRLAHSQVPPGDLLFWHELAFGCAASGMNQDTRLTLARSLVDAPQSDAGKAAALPIAFLTIDVDAPAERQALFQIVSRYRDAKAWPLTSRVLRKMDIEIALRTGAPFDLNEALDAFSGDAGFNRDVFTVSVLMSKRDIAGLRSELESLGTDELLRPQSIDQAIVACDVAGLTDEAALARQVGRTELQRAVLQAWQQPTSHSISHALRLSHILGDPDGLPRAWRDDMEQKVKDPLTLLKIQLEDACLQKDWQKVAALAGQAIKSFPTFYFLYRFQGEALHHLGKDPEALAALEKYTSHSKDEVEYPQAMALIDSIKQKDTPKHN